MNEEEFIFAIHTIFHNSSPLIWGVFVDSKVSEW